MRVTVRKWGNSASVRIPSAVMEAACLTIDHEVDIREEHGRIVIEPLRPSGFDLDTLLGAITPENLHGEEDFGGPAGDERL